jgi:hemerythrin
MVSMINILKWDDSLATGFDEVDLQHKKLILIIDDVYHSMQEPAEEYAILMAKDLKRLTDYTQYHFTEEESFMKKHSFPGYEAHRKEHEAFIAEVARQIQTLSRAEPEDGFRFYRFLGTWLLNHIAKSDHAWAAYIAKSGKK